MQKGFKVMMNALAFTIALMPVVAPNTALARRGGDGDNRSAFYGIVQARPKTVLQGEWMIGGRTFTADAGTEFDQAEGDLRIGSCAKVDVRATAGYTRSTVNQCATVSESASCTSN